LIVVVPPVLDQHPSFTGITTVTELAQIDRKRLEYNGIDGKLFGFDVSTGYGKLGQKSRG
jgi:hypothetical protein